MTLKAVKSKAELRVPMIIDGFQCDSEDSSRIVDFFPSELDSAIDWIPFS
ncbi:MAG: hypothetical protein WDN07_03580 [Actinomycetota bacterium]